jgi:hypothetical protein
MQPLQLEPKTGFLEQPHLPSAFNAERKQQLLEMIRDHPHRTGIDKACREIGISDSTFWRHIEADKAFREAWERLKKGFAYRVEDVLAHCALDPKKTIDRLAYLRAYMPEKYNPVQKSESQITITIDGNMLSQAKSERNVIEAEIVGKESANSGDNGHIISTMQGESTKGHDIQQLPNT